MKAQINLFSDDSGKITAVLDGSSDDFYEVLFRAATNQVIFKVGLLLAAKEVLHLMDNHGPALAIGEIVDDLTDKLGSVVEDC
jgi:hypothetical protein